MASISIEKEPWGGEKWTTGEYFLEILGSEKIDA